jgi:hypothetical protein
MVDNIHGKGLVLVIFALLLGLVISPNINGNITKTSNAWMQNHNGKTSLFNDAPGEEWNCSYGGNLSDAGFSVEETSDGGYIIQGVTYSYGEGEEDIWLIKTDDQGEELWNVTFGGTYEDYGFYMQGTNDDGFIITGYTKSYGAGGSDAWLVKTDSTGNKEWDKTFGGTDHDRGCSLKQLEDGGYIIVGHTYSFGGGIGNAWLIKTDDNGEEEWNKTFGGASDDAAFSIQETSDGGYIIQGVTLSYAVGDVDIWLIKIDKYGNEAWNRTYGNSGLDWSWSCQQTSDGGYAVFGYTDAYLPEILWLIKTDENGIEQWNNSYGSELTQFYDHYDLPFRGLQVNDGGFIICFIGSYDTDDYDACIIKTDESGIEEWSTSIGGTDHDGAISIQQTSDSGYILTGFTDSYATGIDDAWLIKLESEGGTPDIVVDEIRGGIRVSAEVKNIGTETAINVSWSIDMDNAWIILRGELTEDVISELAAGESETIRQRSLFVIGKDVLITVSAGSDVKYANASWVLGPLVLGLT